MLKKCRDPVAESQFGVVYSGPGLCCMAYIGQAPRGINDRHLEHQRNIKEKPSIFCCLGISVGAATVLLGGGGYWYYVQKKKLIVKTFQILSPDNCISAVSLDFYEMTIHWYSG